MQHDDIQEAFENMHNYVSEKLGVPHSWHQGKQDQPLTLSMWVQQALHNEVSFSGTILFDRIEEEKKRIAERPLHEKALIIEGLWHEIHEHMNS